MANRVEIEFKAAVNGAVDDIGKVNQALGDTTKAGKGSSLSLTDLASGINLAVGGFKTAAAAVNAFVTPAAEAQRITAQTEAVIKSTGGAAGMTAQSIIELASALESQSTFADDAIQEGENLLLTFTNIGRDVFPDATQAMVDMAAAMGTDVKSGAIQLGKALNDPVQGISALTRVGVTFTEQQKDTIKQMVAMNDVAGAQRIILDELNKEFGGSAAAQVDTYAGSVAQLKNEWDNFLEVAGGAVLPFLTDFAHEGTQFIEYWQNATDAVLSGRESLIDFETTGLSVIFTDKTLSDANAELTASQEAYTTALEAQDPVVLNARLATEAQTAATAAAQKASDDAAASVEAQTLRWQGLADMYEGRTTPAAYGYLEAADLLTEGLSGLTEQLIFNKAAANLSDEAALQLGISMGLVDTRVLELNEALPALKEKYDTNHDGTIDATESTAGYAAAVQALTDALMAVPANVTSTVTTNFVQNGSPYSGPASGSTPLGQNQNYTNQDARASGGTVLSGGSYIVGEEGPEAFFPDQNGFIMNATDTRDLIGAIRAMVQAVGQMGNSVTNNFYSNGTGGDNSGRTAALAGAY